MHCFTTQVLFRPGAVVRLDLATTPSILGGAFVGTLPAGAGVGFMRWSGPTGTPIDAAIATIGRDVDAIYFWDVSRQAYRQYVVGGAAGAQTYTVVDPDDIVMVRVK